MHYNLPALCPERADLNLLTNYTFFFVLFSFFVFSKACNFPGKDHQEEMEGERGEGGGATGLGVPGYVGCRSGAMHTVEKPFKCKHCNSRFSQVT